MTIAIEHGATVVITHRVQAEKISLYEEWLNQISSAAKVSSGLLDWQIIRPIPDITATYTILLRFNSLGELKLWMNSEERKQYIEKVRSLLVNGDDYYVGSGLDFLFMQNNVKGNIPKRWKQFLITWSAIYPLSLIIPKIILPALGLVGMKNFWLNGLFVTAVIVFLMIYIVMPRYTKLVQHWLTTK